VDTSALAKLVIEEPESGALRRYLAQGEPMYASRIAAVELRRAVRRQDDRAAYEQAELVLGAVRLIELDDEMARAAGELRPPSLRTVDAVHVAAALTLGDECDAFVSYDTRLNDAVKQAGLAVQSPANEPT
jgi:predicted nucleic acid-binding protein